MKKQTMLSIFGILLLSVSCKKKNVEPTTSEVPIKTFTTTVDLAYNNTQPDPACFIDLDKGLVYKVSEALQHQAEIDLVYVLRYFNANDPIILSIGDFDGHPGLPISDWTKTTLGINQFTTFNHTTLNYASSYNTATGFNAITTVNGLISWLNGNTTYHEFLDVTPATIGDIFLFNTHQNKKGALKVLDCQNGSAGYVKMEIKIEP
jgi:hypothetical protein